MVFDMLLLDCKYKCGPTRQMAVSGRASMKPPPKKTETMNELSRWDPFRELEDMQHRLSSVLGRQTQRRPDGGRESITVAEWAPLVDISEDDKEYLIKVELPEVKKKKKLKLLWKMAFSSFLATVSLRKRKKAESITGSSELTAASVAVLRCRKMPTPKR